MSPARSIGVMLIVGALLLWAMLSIIEGFPSPPQPQCVRYMDLPHNAQPQCEVWAP